MQKLSDLRKNDTKANKSNACIISLYNLLLQNHSKQSMTD